MSAAPSVLDCIGDTPLIRLKGASAATGCDILGKAEFMNPGGSVKDRAALAIVRDAETRGLLKPGGEIVEGTAGNTGIGLSMVASVLGYRTTIVIPRTQSEEKKDALRLWGAELVEVDAVPYANPGNYVRVSERLAAERGAFWANQFDNLANRAAHATTTGPEIWRQTESRLDGFCCAIGSGGTLAGVAAYLREQKPDIAIALADPFGSALFNWFTAGELRLEGSSVTEGIGQGRITRNIGELKVDHAFQIEDAEALEICFRLVREEGLLLGGSSGINIAGAMRLARALGPGHVVATILCDSGQRYQSRMFNPAFLREKGLPVPPWLGET